MKRYTELLSAPRHRSSAGGRIRRLGRREQYLLTRVGKCPLVRRRELDALEIDPACLEDLVDLLARRRQGGDLRHDGRVRIGIRGGGAERRQDRRCDGLHRLIDGGLLSCWKIPTQRVSRPDRADGDDADGDNDASPYVSADTTAAFFTGHDSSLHNAMRGQSLSELHER